MTVIHTAKEYRLLNKTDRESLMGNVLRTDITSLIARASLKAMDLCLKTLSDRDQYVTALRNSSHWSDIYFWVSQRNSMNTE